ncbi:hypothetical protein V498_00221 [Pseudogymnoascus sp. VKM F-4517 (FW-2822)]|nr:hypothetical protein V498_00221 [Pseudogymnoascus sp. VKM F-4517 (FW-2822)]
MLDFGRHNLVAWLAMMHLQGRANRYRQGLGRPARDPVATGESKQPPRQAKNRNLIFESSKTTREIMLFTFNASIINTEGDLRPNHPKETHQTKQAFQTISREGSLSMLDPPFMAARELVDTSPLTSEDRSERRSGSSSYASIPSRIATSEDSCFNGKQSSKQAIQPYATTATGDHEHHLASIKLEQNVTGLIRTMLSGIRNKKARIRGASTSAEAFSGKLNRGRQSQICADPEHANVSPSLVEKYGSCREIIGRGAFGLVRVSHKSIKGGTEQLFAVKEVCRQSDENEEGFRRRLTEEYRISSSLIHPNIIHTLDLMHDARGGLCEVMEFCAGGDLHRLLLETKKLDSDEADCFFKQLLCGVNYMHEMGIAHRDLKPENLVLTTRGALKITDFGNSERFRIAELGVQMVGGVCGSSPYIAPEEYTDQQFDARAVDIWATGMIYMVMRTGRYLWMKANEHDGFFVEYVADRRTEEGYGPIESLGWSKCSNVVYSLLDPYPTRRLTASQFLRTKWARETQLCKAGQQGL